MPDLIRHPVPFWIPAFAGMTTVGYLTAEVICMNEYLNLVRVGGVASIFIQNSGIPRPLVKAMWIFFPAKRRKVLFLSAVILHYHNRPADNFSQRQNCQSFLLYARDDQLNFI